MAFKRMAVGLAIGYVLGAKAGDKKYKELQGRWQDLKDRPGMQRALERGRDLARIGGQRAVGALEERFGGATDDDASDRSRTRDHDAEDEDAQHEASDEAEDDVRGEDESAMEDDAEQDDDEQDDETEGRDESELEGDDDAELEDEDESDLEDDEDDESEEEDDPAMEAADDADVDDEDDQDEERDHDEDRGLFGSIGRFAGQVRERGRVA